jgi:hypothetical protein
MQLLRRGLSAIIAVAISSLGLWMAYLGQYYYLSTLQFPYGSIPFWKSAIILLLIAACVLMPLYAGYRLMKFAFARG